ncbi:DUF4037 domain-containing protein [Kitasatospora cineracea]|uniref:DUF4037 domain-containing protein n=1 Tax=Kitasatospora cineracea TaxID=88074 RepID=UPI0036D9CD8B
MIAPAPPDPPFVPGLDLARALYEEAVRPILAATHPGLPYAAARIGPGSEVLGLDSARSTDHDWGPRLQLFLAPDDARRHGPALHRLLAERLPGRIRGWSTHYRGSGDPDDPVSHLAPADGPVDHRVTVHDLPGWLAERLGPPAAAWTAAEPSATDWLALPQQRLAEFTGGAVLHDGPGTLTAARARLRWYPDQVWRHLLACQWQRIAQEEAFVGRCAEAGDDLGAPDPAAKARHLADAYEAAARAHNALGLTEPLDPARRRYHSRPYPVLHADRFARSLQRTVTEPQLRDRPLIGAVDQWADSTDLLAHPGVVRAAVDALAGED